MLVCEPLSGHTNIYQHTLTLKKEKKDTLSVMYKILSNVK